MPKCPISGFVQVGKAAPIGFRLVVGLGQQANALIDSIVGVLSAIRNVWSAALSQAKNEDDGLVCANVSGL